MNLNELIYQLYNLKGFGRVKINKALSKVCYTNSELNINSIIENLSEEYNIEINNINDFKNIIELAEIKLNKQIKYLNLYDKEYPEFLNTLKQNKPPVISYLGNIELFKKQKIGFCGSRKASEKGFEIAKDISQQVSNKNVTIVSGYASGIDLETHYWALKNNGTTIIVLPEGICNFSIKRKLKDVWDWEKVLVISEFEPNAIWNVNRAMTRNSTIVALSDIMILIEAREKGGSINAGLKAIQYNKALFAPLYFGMPEEASGNQLLLNKGALPLRKSKETNRANLNKMFEIFEHNKNFKHSLF